MRPLLGSLLVIVAATHAGAADDPHVRARLVADTGELVPGSTLRIGVLFEMDPGWHVYWKNPGDAGLATEVVFGPPYGFAIGPIGWPIPESFTQPGELMAFGYERELLLAAELRVPKRNREIPPCLEMPSRTRVKDVRGSGQARVAID